MFLHIGGNKIILERDIIAIIDRESIDSSSINKYFIDNMKREDILYNGDKGNIKTYIITCVKELNSNIKEYKLYATNISSATLLKRNRHMENRLEAK